MAKRFNLDKALSNAARITVNKIITKAKTSASRKVRETYYIKAKDLNKSMKIKRAGYTDKEATLTVRGRRIQVYAFGARQTRTGVTVRIRRDRGRKLIRHAFIAAMPTGHTGAFQRKRKSRLPIREIYSLSPAQMFEYEGAKEINLLIERDGGKILQHEIDYQMSKFKR